MITLVMHKIEIDPFLITVKRLKIIKNNNCVTSYEGTASPGIVEKVWI